MYWIFVVLLVLLAHMQATQFTYDKGRSVGAGVWDIMHANFPDLSEYNYVKNWYLLVFVAPLLWNWPSPAFLTEFGVKFGVLCVLRILTMMVTILPKSDKCYVYHEQHKLSLFNKLFGGSCYDKMFSGHFSFGLLLTLLMFKFGYVSNPVVWTALNALHVMLLGVTRAHYTVDILVGAILTVLVFLVKA